MFFLWIQEFIASYHQVIFVQVVFQIELSFLINEGTALMSCLKLIRRCLCCNVLDRQVLWASQEQPPVLISSMGQVPSHPHPPLVNPLPRGDLLR